MKSVVTEGYQLEKGGDKPGCAALCRSEASSHLKTHSEGSFIGKTMLQPSLISHVKM